MNASIFSIRWHSVEFWSVHGCVFGVWCSVCFSFPLFDYGIGTANSGQDPSRCLYPSHEVVNDASFNEYNALYLTSLMASVSTAWRKEKDIFILSLKKINSGSIESLSGLPV